MYSSSSSSSSSSIIESSSSSSYSTSLSETSQSEFSWSSEQRKRYANQYRFSGYQLPMIQLDSTGPNYIQINRAMRHPYYTRQPAYWGKSYYWSDPNMSGSNMRKALHGRLYPLLNNTQNNDEQ